MKTLLIILCLFTITAKAQKPTDIYVLRATNLSYMPKPFLNSEERPSHVLITIGLNHITIYSKVKQEFDVYEYGINNNDECTKIIMLCIDKYGKKCEIVAYRGESIVALSVFYDDKRYSYDVREELLD